MTLPPRLDSSVRITVDAVPNPGKELEYGRALDGMLAQARSWPGCRTAAYFRTNTGFEVSIVDTPQRYSTWGTSASLAGARRATLALERAAAIGLWGASAGVGVALGPIAGGWLLERFWWGSIFLFMVPLAALVAVLAAWRVPASRDARGSPARCTPPCTPARHITRRPALHRHSPPDPSCRAEGRANYR